MKRLLYRFVTLLFISILTFFIIHSVSALTYQSGVGMKFTFNPTLTVSLSDTDLEIAELAAGTYADSNVITVSVNTNVSYGYTLSATAGNSSYSGSSNFNANDLVLTNGLAVDTTQTNFFSALSTSDSLSSMSLADTDTWGYTYSSDSGTTWANYSGLPLYTAESGAELISTEEAADSSSVQFKIAAKASNDKSSGEYTNVVNFVAVANPLPPTLYDTVAAMTKGTQTVADLKEPITTPTSTDRTEDTSNSGVYTYDSTVFGESSDASNDYPIYYYRGILETDPEEEYGDGSANTYPNYVKLNNGTCWRIVRTTGSGGVKMFVSGAWDTTENACLSGSIGYQHRVFAVQGSSVNSSWYRNTAYSGYTFNDAVTDVTTEMPIGTVLGSNSNYSTTNTTDSELKDFIENNWYTSNIVTNMSAYTSFFEPSAGYCFDRSIYDGTYTLLSENDTIIPFNATNRPYYGSDVRVGSASHNVSGAHPTLGCPRGKVDIYTTQAASDGNRQLKYPVALLTFDEVTLGGKSSSLSDFAYSNKTYLTGIGWLFSPSGPFSGYAYVAILETWAAGDSHVQTVQDFAPVVSLIPGTVITGGSGTKTDPWTIE